MNLNQLVEALDAQIVRGDILGAFDQFFADNCVTLSSANDITRGKAEKRQSLGWFFDGMARTNRIERLQSRVDGDVSYSEFVFDFTDRQGRNHAWHEVIRRRWENGRVVEERYFTDLSNDNPLHRLAATSEATAETKPAARKKAAAATTTTKEAPAAKPMKESSPKKTAPAAGLSGTRSAKAPVAKKASAASADTAGVNGEAAPAKKAATRKKA
jgi:ketosteroid isomerase-like protein